jgi:hypothetical protein
MVAERDSSDLRTSSAKAGGSLGCCDLSRSMHIRRDGKHVAVKLLNCKLATDHNQDA